MLKKIVDNMGFAGGLLFLIGMLISYFFDDLWNIWVQLAVYGGLVMIAVYLIAQAPALIAALGTRGGKRGSLAGISLLLVIGIIVLVNFLNYRHHQRWDFSENSLQSLAEQSVKIASNLDRDVKVIGFYENPGAATQFENLIKEYTYVSPRISYEVVDPQKDPAKVQQYQVERNGQIVVSSGARTQKIDQAREEDLTNAIIKVTRDKEKVVYFLTGHGERSIDSSEPDGYLSMKGAIEGQNYSVKEVNLAGEGKIPEDASLLVAAGPRSNFLPGEVPLLEDFLAQGGKLFLMAEPRTNFDMNDFLQQYGLKLRDDFILDPSPVGQLFGLGPASPLVTAYPPHPITEDFEYTTFFPTARSLELVASPLGYQTQALFSSSARAWGETDLSEGSRPQPDEGKDALGPLVMAAVAVHKEEDEVGGDVPEDTEESETPESRLLLVGDSDFVANRFAEASDGNVNLFLNMVSWMMEDEDLVAVRPKDPTDRKVTLTSREANILFWGLVVFLPIATLVLGVGIWYRRR